MKGRGSVTRRGRTRSLVIMGVTTVIILAVTYVTNRPASGGSLTSIVLSGRATGPPPTIGKPAPDFAATTIDGVKTSLRKFRGRPVWLTFGATWCQPCRAEAPDIEAAYKKHREEGLVVLAVFIREGAAAVKDYTTRVGLTFPRVADTTTQIASTYRILGIPTHFFIDRTGVLRATMAGRLDPPTIESAISGITG